MNKQNHYIHFDSTDRNQIEEKTDFVVKLSTPIKHVHRVALINFTIPNTTYNITKNTQDVYWIENLVGSGEYDPNAVKMFTIKLDIGYYTMTELIAAVELKMNAVTQDVGGNSRQYNTETLPSYTLTLDENNYTVTMSADSGGMLDSNKIFKPLLRSHLKFKSSVWHLMGFAKEQCHLFNAKYQTLTLPIQSTNYTSNLFPIGQRSIKGLTSYKENISRLILGSDELSSNTYKTTHESYIHTKKTNILDVINVNVNRYSWIHYNPDSQNYKFHNFHGETLSSFDIKLYTEDYNLFSYTEVPEFSGTILVETIEPHNLIMNAQTTDLKHEAYQLEHRRR